MKWDVIKSCEFVRDEKGHYQLKVQAEHADLDTVWREMIKRFKPIIIEFLNTIDPPEDWETYEGGVDDWWGPGSVGLWELCLTFNIKLTSDGMDITIN